MKLFLLGISLLLVNLTQSLPVKESTTTKDPNEHKAEGDSNTQNLENIIGKSSSSLSSSCEIISICLCVRRI